MSGMSRRVVIGAVLGVVVAAGAVVAALWLHGSGNGPGPEVAAYLQAWRRFDTTAMAKVVDRPPRGFATAVRAMRQDLRVDAAVFRAGATERHGSQATVVVQAQVGVGGLG